MLLLMIEYLKVYLERMIIKINILKNYSMQFLAMHIPRKLLMNMYKLKR